MLANTLNDIEDFTADELRAEIRRREAADARHECWYCGKNLAAHTCKHATASPAPGWEVQPPRFVRTDDCMGRDAEYWQVDARNPVTGKCRLGYGRTAAEATEECLESIRKLRGVTGEATP